MPALQYLKQSAKRPDLKLVLIIGLFLIPLDKEPMSFDGHMVVSNLLFGELKWA